MTHDDFIRSVAFSPNGQYVISGSGDGKIKTLFFSANEYSCNVLTRNLSNTEWTNLIGSNYKYNLTCPNLSIGKNYTPGLEGIFEIGARTATAIAVEYIATNKAITPTLAITPVK